MNEELLFMMQSLQQTQLLTWIGCYSAMFAIYVFWIMPRLDKIGANKFVHAVILSLMVISSMFTYPNGGSG